MINMEGNKMYVFLVIGIVVGAAVGIGAGYMMFNDSDCSSAEEYNFYICYGATDADNGWYSASGDNATEAFDKAMDKAGIEYVANSGYISSIDGVGTMWSTIQYTYSMYTEAAEAASILYPNYSGYGGFISSNGWVMSNGFNIDGYDGLKFCEFESNTYFLSVYDDVTYAFETPVSYTGWMDEGPFA